MPQGSILSYIQQKPQKPSYSIELTVQKNNELFQSVEKNQKTRPAPEITQITTSLLDERQQTVIDARPRDDKIEIGSVHADNIQIVKSITCSVLPVRYADKFFKECIDENENSILSAVAIYSGKVVGWIRCRVEPFPNVQNSTSTQIYIQVLAILAPYRGLGMAVMLLDTALTQAKMRGHKASSIYAHVWEGNEDGLEWYEKRGFRRIILQPAYYRRLKPSGAWLVRREV